MFTVRLPLLFLLLLQTCQAAGDCEPSSCGEIPIIKPPFRLTTDPAGCGSPEYSLSCESNATVLHLRSRKYYMQSINYGNLTIRLVANGVVNGNCSSLPTNPLDEHSFTSSDPYYPTRTRKTLLSVSARTERLTRGLALISCDKPVTASTLYLETAPCIDFGANSSSYAVTTAGANFLELAEGCRLEMVALLPKSIKEKDYKVPFQEIHRQLEYGFELSWHLYKCACPDTEVCYVYGDNNVACTGLRETIIMFALYYVRPLIIRVAEACLLMHLLGIPPVIAFLIYKWRKRHQSAYVNIEEFLQNQTLMPIRYSYSNIKTITRGFRDKLGEGGFGCVYKAKLRGGSFAAVKILGTKKSTIGTAAGEGEQDFMNEVATVGRIHHANVVRLIGFCAEGSKRALVYEFMPNGSLDKHISRKQGDHRTSSLSLEQLYHISLGVARGIEYLHHGCAMQILHFDIKPHNILLDENFTPKVSDFGLARLNQAGRDNNIATLTAARGTIGYMAPELFYKNIGGVSYKADVYSFGMLLLEMAGKRGNLNATPGHSSVYFPSWVHNEVSTPGNPIAIGEVTEEEDDIAKKMVIVGLWCIQTSPANRPPMNKVVEMLEGDLESLQLPPKPVLYAAETVTKNEEGSSSSSSSFLSSEFTQSNISTVSVRNDGYSQSQ